MVGPRRLLLLAWLFILLGGCTNSPQAEGTADLIWGDPGITTGHLQKPRAIAIDEQDQLYIVDMTARIQVFDAEGNYLRGWKTPVSKNGRPSGLTIDRAGRLLVADTHYYRVLVYDTSGETPGSWSSRQPSVVRWGRLRANLDLSPTWSKTLRATFTSANTAILTASKSFLPSGNSSYNGERTAAN